jgi:hypothetical protein
MSLVDTPGVGGLDSAHGFLTIGALRHAQGMLFVTDAAQELTGPELSFLRTSLERCPRAALVITKIDIYPQWRRIADLDRGHLDRAGLNIPVIPVSSFLRLRAVRDSELNAESGFEELVTFLARDVVANSRVEAARTAALEVDFVASQLEHRTEVERTVIESPEQGAQVVADLTKAQHEASRLAAPTATWQQTLGDGIQDLVSDVEHDLQRRLRMVQQDAEQMIGEGDPGETWSDIEVWLRRQVAMVTVENRDLLTQRAQELATTVADQFDLQAGSAINLNLADIDHSIESVSFASKSSLSLQGGKVAPLVSAARSGVYIPMMLGSVALNLIPGVGTLLSASIISVSVALGAGIGGKIIKDERTRHRTYRQQQAKVAVRKFIDEVAFVMNKQTRDGLRATQRQLRDDFHARALLMHRSAVESMAAAKQVAQLSTEELNRRRQQLDHQEGQLDQVRAAARELVSARG